MKHRILTPWLPRFAACALAVLAAASPVPAGAAHFVVESTEDAHDLDLRDGDCISQIKACTLRAAVEQSNYLGGFHTIELGDETYLLKDRLTVEAGIAIQGRHFERTRIDCEYNSPAFIVDGTGELHLGYLAVQRCQESENRGFLHLAATLMYRNTGPALRNFHNLEVTGSIFLANAGRPGASGGAIANEPDAVLKILESTFDSNTSETDGGAIANRGDIILGASRFLRNSARGRGGAIHNSGTLDVDEVTFQKNSAAEGGALYTPVPGRTWVWKSSFVGNQASSRGGAVLSASFVQLVSSTVSGNRAYAGGGLYGVGEPDVLWLANATVTRNIAAPVDNTAGGEGGGLYGAAVLQNTILAGNTSNGRGEDCFSGSTPPVSRDHNIIGIVDDCHLYLAGRDAAGTAKKPLDPQLLPLDDTTRYPPFHAPDPRSLAVDFGNPGGCETPDGTPISNDQLANPRHQGAACDAGAVEVTPSPDPV